MQTAGLETCRPFRLASGAATRARVDLAARVEGVLVAAVRGLRLAEVDARLEAALACSRTDRAGDAAGRDAGCAWLESRGVPAGGQPELTRSCEWPRTHEGHSAAATVQSLRISASHPSESGAGGEGGPGGDGPGALEQEGTPRAWQKKSVCSSADAAPVCETPGSLRKPKDER